MGMERKRKRKVSLFDVVDDTCVSAKLAKTNGFAVHGNGTNPLVNRWNGRPYTKRYLEILEKRKTLPVWHQKEEFLQALKANQTLILVGETGSGKTTQVSLHKFLGAKVSQLVNLFSCPENLRQEERKLKWFP